MQRTGSAVGQLVELRHPTLGFDLTVPVELAATVEESDQGYVLRSERGDGDEATIAIAAESVEPGAALDALVKRALAGQARLPGSARLIDWRRERVGGLPAVRTVACRQFSDGLMTIEEWRMLAGETLLTLSASCSSSTYDGHAEGFAAIAGSLRIDGERSRPGRADTRFDSVSGLLVISDHGFDALRAIAAGGTLEGEPAVAEAKALAAAGALIDGRPHPVLEAALRPVLEPLLELMVAHADSRSRAWLDERDASLLVPAEGEWHRLVVTPAPQLPDLVAELVGLGPRPAEAQRETFTLTSPELARSIAEQDGPAEGLRVHWRVEAHRPAAPTGELVEVIDSASGLWLVVPQDEAVELRPSDPATVWRHLTRLVTP